MGMPAILPDTRHRQDVASLLRAQRKVVSWNSGVYEGAVRALEASTTADREKQVAGLRRVFEEFAAGRGALPDQAPVPTRIRQQVVARIHARVLSQMWALDYCDAQTVMPGEQLAYRVQGVKLPSVYKLAEPGGNWVEIHRNRDGYVTLGDPLVYTVPEIWIPRWNPMFPERYLEDLAYVADVAGIAMAEQMESDAVTAVNAQFYASGMRAAAFDWISSRVQNATVPDTNIIAGASVTEKVDMGVYKALAIHAMKLGRTIARMDMAPDTIGTMWDSVSSGTNFPTWPEAAREALFRGGEESFTPMFGMNFPQPRPNNSIDISDTNKYFYVLLEPSDPLSPRGACWMYTWPPPDDLGQSGSAYVVDNLEYLRTVTNGPRVYDVFVVQKNVLFASVAYQAPNVVKVQYADA